MFVLLPQDMAQWLHLVWYDLRHGPIVLQLPFFCMDKGPGCCAITTSRTEREVRTPRNPISHPQLRTAALGVRY